MGAIGLHSQRYKKNMPNPFPILLSDALYLARHAVNPATETAQPICAVSVYKMREMP